MIGAIQTRVDSLRRYVRFQSNERLLIDVMLVLSLAVILFVVLFPILWTASTAFRGPEGVYSSPHSLLPDPFSTVQFEELFSKTDILMFYWNSILITAGVVVLTTVTATLSGYGLTRLRFRFKQEFATGVLIGYMFPPILLGIPMFLLWREVNLINTRFGVVLGITALALPFSIWLMWQFFQTVPESLEEAAMACGASRFRAFYDVALPLAKPGVIAIIVFSYAVAWNAYTIPLLLLTDRSKWPLTVGIDQAFVQIHSVDWGLVMAATIAVIVPSFLLVYTLQKYLLRGFRIGSVG